MTNDNFRFLVVGAGRGGTSLLAGLLDYHPDLEVALELHSVEYLMGRELPGRGPDMFHERATAFAAACNETASRYPGKIWGNKITTEQIFGLEDHNLANPGSEIDILDGFFNKCLKGVKIVFILRDGRACVKSKVERTGQSMATACENWRRSVRCYGFLKERHGNNVLIRFEDLLVDPKATLKAVCNFLGIRYRRKMLKGVGNTKMLPEYRKKSFDRSKLAPVPIPEEHFRSIEGDLRYCGYV